MKSLFITAMLFLYGGVAFGQRPILFDPQDSVYLVPPERAFILAEKAQRADEYELFIDSLMLRIKKDGEHHEQEIDLISAEYSQMMDEALADCEKEKKDCKPTFFERIGISAFTATTRFVMWIIETTTKK